MRSPVLRGLLVATILVVLAGIYTLSTSPTPFLTPSLHLSGQKAEPALSGHEPLPTHNATDAADVAPVAPQIVLPPARSHILPIPANVLVVNLQRRTDRRAIMERLRANVDRAPHSEQSDSEWVYVPAQDARADFPVRVLHRVRAMREAIFASYPSEDWEYEENGPYGLDTYIKMPFAWPEPMPPYPNPALLDDPFSERALAKAFPGKLHDPFPPLTWAEKDYAVEPYMRNKFFHLNRAVAACYRSHVAVLELAAAQPEGVPSLILEDDIDMEVDIAARVERVWDALPPDWDVVFLGHCWSNETFFEPLPLSQRHSQAQFSANSPRIYPSHAPLCLHAYVVSPRGAALLLSHLTYPAFAYSRPVDNAIARLVETRRLKSFTIVPNVVIQREKRGLSDISGRIDNQGGWNATLVNGFFDLHSELAG